MWDVVPVRQLLFPELSFIFCERRFSLQIDDGLIQISGGNSETVFKSYEICASQSRIIIALYTGLVFHTYGNNVYHMVIIILYVDLYLININY